MLWSSDDASLRELGLRWKKNAKKAAKLKREPKFAGKKVRLPFVLVFLCRSTLDSLLTHLPPASWLCLFPFLSEIASLSLPLSSTIQLLIV